MYTLPGKNVKHLEELYLNLNIHKIQSVAGVLCHFARKKTQWEKLLNTKKPQTTSEYIIFFMNLCIVLQQYFITSQLRLLRIYTVGIAIL